MGEEKFSNLFGWREARQRYEVYGLGKVVHPISRLSVMRDQGLWSTGRGLRRPAGGLLLDVFLCDKGHRHSQNGECLPLMVGHQKHCWTRASPTWMPVTPLQNMQALLEVNQFFRSKKDFSDVQWKGVFVEVKEMSRWPPSCSYEW